MLGIMITKEKPRRVQEFLRPVIDYAGFIEVNVTLESTHAIMANGCDMYRFVYCDENMLDDMAKVARYLVDEYLIKFNKSQDFLADVEIPIYITSFKPRINMAHVMHNSLRH